MNGVVLVTLSVLSPVRFLRSGGECIQRLRTTMFVQRNVPANPCGVGTRANIGSVLASTAVTSHFWTGSEPLHYVYLEFFVPFCLQHYPREISLIIFLLNC